MIMILKISSSNMKNNVRIQNSDYNIYEVKETNHQYWSYKNQLKYNHMHETQARSIKNDAAILLFRLSNSNFKE